MLRLLTEQLRQTRFDRLSPDHVALLVQVQQIGHHPASQYAIIVHEIWTDVELVDVVAIGQFKKDRVGLLVHLTPTVFSVRAARKDRQQQHIRIGQFVDASGESCRV